MDSNRSNQPAQMRGRLVDNLIQVENFIKMKPGQVSPELRRALGLRDDELPLYIDKMWIHGYPPGYLKKKVWFQLFFILLFLFFHPAHVLANRKRTGKTTPCSSMMEKRESLRSWESTLRIQKWSSCRRLTTLDIMHPSRLVLSPLPRHSGRSRASSFPHRSCQPRIIAP